MKLNYKNLQEELKKVNIILPKRNDSLDFYKELHRALIEFNVIDGEFTCYSCQRKFKIKEGIPNMLIN